MVGAERLARVMARQPELIVWLCRIMVRIWKASEILMKIVGGWIAAALTA